MARVAFAMALLAILVMPGVAADSAQESTPTGLDATVTPDGAVQLFWSAPAVDAVEYKLYRNGEFLGTSPDESFLDDNPEPAAAYQVAAVSGGSEGTASDPVTVVLVDAAEGEDGPAEASWSEGDTRFVVALRSGGIAPVCWPAGVTVKSTYPFVFVYVDWWCIEQYIKP